MAGRTMAFSYDHRVDMAIEARLGRPRRSRSMVLRRLVGGYLEAIKRSRPKLEDSEWGFLTQALSNPEDLDAEAVAGLPGIVRRPLPPGDPLRRWGVNPERLAAKLAELPYAGLLAVVDQLIVERTIPKG